MKREGIRENRDGIRGRAKRRKEESGNLARPEAEKELMKKRKNLIANWEQKKLSGV